MYEYMFNNRSTADLKNLDLEQQYSSGFEMIRGFFTANEQEELKIDTYLFLVLLNGLIAAHISGRHGMTSELFDTYLKKAFERILGKYQLSAGIPE